MKKVSPQRWELAQKNEKKVWENINEDFIKNHSAYYKKKSNFILEECSKFFKISDSTKILQIGCGPLDIINFIEAGKKFSIDPLADFYKSKFKIDYKKSNLVSGVGENLPYPDKFFDVILFANVLDHTNNAEKVMSEIKRVIKPRGILYIEAHFYQKGFIQLAGIYGFLKKILTSKIFNQCHPYMFQLDELKKIISEKFSIVKEEELGKDIEKEINNLKELKESLKKEKFTRSFPARFGLLGFINYSCFCVPKK